LVGKKSQILRDFIQTISLQETVDKNANSCNFGLFSTHLLVHKSVRSTPVCSCQQPGSLGSCRTLHSSWCHPSSTYQCAVCIAWQTSVGSGCRYLQSDVCSKPISITHISISVAAVSVNIGTISVLVPSSSIADDQACSRTADQRGRPQKRRTFITDLHISLYIHVSSYSNAKCFIIATTIRLSIVDLMIVTNTI